MVGKGRVGAIGASVGERVAISPIVGCICVDVGFSIAGVADGFWTKVGEGGVGGAGTTILDTVGLGAGFVGKKGLLTVGGSFTVLGRKVDGKPTGD